VSYSLGGCGHDWCKLNHAANKDPVLILSGDRVVSRIAGFHKMSVARRREKLIKQTGITSAHTDHLSADTDELTLTADRLVENVIGTYQLPLGIATNLIVDKEPVLVPMVTEESSVIAAVCNGARQCRESGGVQTVHTGRGMIGQVQITGLSNPHAASVVLHQFKEQILTIGNACDPRLVELGGGLRDIQTRVITNPNATGQPTQLIVHLIVDTLDAMGANAVNTMAETLAPHFEQWSGGQVGLKILSNLADQRLVKATACWDAATIGGTQVCDAIVRAGDFAQLDPYRATTHNKGIMNGVSAVVQATGNDTRAVEAGAHAYAARTGQYSPLSLWEKDSQGNLCGTLELPMAVGMVGGATRVHPGAQMCLEIMKINSARRLASIVAAVGLVQNFSALKALATEGIQRGHMALHAKNVAISAGATGDDIDAIAEQMVELGTVREDVATELLSRVDMSDRPK